MDKVVNLLTNLKENGLNKTYNSAIQSLSIFRNTLIAAKDEVNDEIMRLILEDKHIEIGNLGPIPSLCLEVVEILDSLIPGVAEEVVDNKVVDNKVFENIIDDNSEDEISELNGVITSIKGLKIGAKLLHNTFGIGEVIGFENDKDDKIVKIKFESGERPFKCNSTVLSKYFNLDCTVENIKSKEKGYNLYTNSEFFRHKKPYKIKIFDESFEVTNWVEVPQVLFRYLYLKDSNTFLSLKEVENDKLFSKNKTKFRRPHKVYGDLFFEGDRHVIDIIKTMSSLSEKYLNVLNKDVRKNVELFVVDR